MSRRLGLGLGDGISMVTKNVTVSGNVNLKFKYCFHDNSFLFRGPDVHTTAPY